MINWYDWIQPTNPFASLFFGVILTIVVTGMVWLETKKVKTSGICLATGVGVSIVGVIILQQIGYYG